MKSVFKVAAARFGKSASTALALALLGASSAHAAATYHFDYNTDPLVALGGSFYVDFQLNGGSPGANSVTISNISFGGGSATAGTSTLSGLGSGDLGTSVTLQDNATHAYNEFYQGFTAGHMLSFDVTTTTTVNTPTPDAFVFAILDNSLFNITTSGTADQLVQLDITGSKPAALTYAGTGTYVGVVAPAAVPLPAVLPMLLGGLGLLGFTARRKKVLAA